MSPKEWHRLAGTLANCTPSRCLDIDAVLDTGQHTLTGNALLIFRQGLAYAAANAYEKALASYDCVLGLCADYYEIWYERGLVLENLCRYPEAIASYNRALELEPAREIACSILSSRGDALQYGLGDYEAAISSYERAIASLPSYYLAWHHRGNALFYGLNHFQAALESYNQAIEINPGFAATWQNRGNVLVEMAHYPEAIASYDQALVLSPDDQAIRYARSRAIDKAGGIDDRKLPTTNPAWYGRGYYEDENAEAVPEPTKPEVEKSIPEPKPAVRYRPALLLEDELGQREIPLTENLCTVGRDPRCTIRIHSQFVSRVHGTLVCLPQPDGSYAYQVVDGTLEGKRSTNGILVNGHKQESWELKAGDRLDFGPNVHAIYLEPTYTPPSI